MGNKQKIKKTKAISGKELTVNYQQLSCNCAETDGRMDGRRDGRTDGRTDGQTDGRTRPLIEMHGRI